MLLLLLLLLLGLPILGFCLLLHVLQETEDLAEAESAAAVAVTLAAAVVVAGAAAVASAAGRPLVCCLILPSVLPGPQ